MNIQKLIIYDNDVLYDILNEVADLLNFSVTKISKNELFKLSKKKGTNFLIVNKKISKITNLTQERSIDVLVTRLRQKIEPDPKNPKYLQTVRGTGYVLWLD